MEQTGKETGKKEERDRLKDLREMMTVYRMPLRERIRYVYLPALLGKLKK